PQGPAAGDPPHPPPPRTPRPRARVPLHARPLRRAPPAPRLARADLPRRTAPHQRDPVAKATRSPAAQRKATTKTTTAGQPAHSLRTLLAELRLQTRNTIRVADTPATFTKTTKPTPLQARALELADTIAIQ